MHIRIPALNHFLLPLCLLGFFGSSVHYLDQIFSVNIRWVLLAILLVYLIIKKRFIIFINFHLLIFVFLYLFWCMLSSAWSDIPFLSLSKSGISFVIVTGMISAGIAWVLSRDFSEALSFLKPLVCVTLLAGFFGLFSPNAYDLVKGSFGLYKGLVHNSNMFGIMLAFSFSFLLWNAYKTWGSIKNRIVSLILICSCIGFLCATLSRTSMLVAVVTGLFFILSLRLNKKIFIALFALIIFLGVFAFNPTLVTGIVGKYIHKYGNLGVVNGVLYSREKPWEDSYNAALAGGWSGLGYGISYGGNSYNFSYGLSAVGYGREKGNSQLAIVEETGIIGLLFYIGIIVFIIALLIQLRFSVRSRDERVLVAIISGLFFGMLAHSSLEAWWTSPGSPESAAFWTLVGVINGLKIVICGKREDDDEFNRIETNTG